MDPLSKGKRARALLDRGRVREAVQIYRDLCAEPNPGIEPDYHEMWLHGMAEGLARLERPVEAAYVHLYLQQFDEALQLLPAGMVLHRARIFEQQRLYLSAARHYEQLTKLVLAAVNYERSGDAQRSAAPQTARESYAQARRCWERLKVDPRLQHRLYEEALVYFNLGTCCLKLSDEAGTGYMVTAQRLLEEAADTFETQGRRERAFDCYQILLEMGRRSGAFENLAEGFINCVRILKEDNLKYYALQYYEDFVREALARREFHAAASLYREAADYCRRTGLIYDRYYLKSAAETWLEAAAKTAEERGAVEMAENALLAAVECYNAVGDYRQVGAAYGKLAALELSKRTVQRYERIAERYAGVGRDAEQPQPFPEYLRQPHAYPEIWYMDLIEWEHGGEASTVCASVIGDLHYPDVVRRRALNVMLFIIEGGGDDLAGRSRIAEGLGDLQIYPVLAPLERLFEGGEEQVQVGVMKALCFLFYKRTFGLLTRGLTSESAEVRSRAGEALGRLRFEHAFDPLVRIFREQDDNDIRLKALESIGSIRSLEAGDFLVEVLRHEPEPLRGAARRLLIAFENRDLFPILRQQVEMEAEPVRSELQQVLRQAGAS